ncbi:hypothetical protein LHK_00089 [Laribacter hongkongensis HLHK9]|uniref:Uncharacterized protein n=2 Tax=Laribacter hongkongensis TaxID=168471 RepID=C1D9X2_LARHH|nr:hypothetical protein LHK_00089 [Laribacter hongkongensis HLHK9]
MADAGVFRWRFRIPVPALPMKPKKLFKSMFKPLLLAVMALVGWKLWQRYRGSDSQQQSLPARRRR